MGEKKRKETGAVGQARNSIAGEPDRVPLPAAVKELTTVIVLWRHVVASGDLAKASELRKALVQWLLRVAACDPQDAEEARIKADFLGERLPALGFTFDPPAQTLVDAALSFDAAQLRPAGSRRG